MFGLSKLFASIGRLTSSINRLADLADAAHEQIAPRLVIDDGPEAIETTATVGETAVRTRKSKGA